MLVMETSLRDFSPYLYDSITHWLQIFMDAHPWCDCLCTIAALLD